MLKLKRNNYKSIFLFFLSLVPFILSKMIDKYFELSFLSAFSCS